MVAGRRTLADSDRLRALLPDAFHALEAVAARLEALFHDAQDFEFTVQDGKFFLLQTRRAQRTPLAALRMAVDMVAEGLMTPEEALHAAGRFGPGVARPHALRAASAGAAGAGGGGRCRRGAAGRSRWTQQRRHGLPPPARRPSWSGRRR